MTTFASIFERAVSRDNAESNAVRFYTGIARNLMQLHGLTGWTLAINKAKRLRGYCDYRRKEIKISHHLLVMGEVDVRSTILHEIAHALVGPGHNHDETWKQKAREIGASGLRCGASMNVAHKWIAQCGHCNYLFKRHRRPLGSFCPCSRSKIPRVPLEWVPAQNSEAP